MKNVLENPSQFLRATQSSHFSRFGGNYTSQLVEDKVTKLGQFEWGDTQSEQLMLSLGQKV